MDTTDGPARGPRRRLLVVGNGMAPGRMLETLLETDRHAFDVTVFNAEPRVNYNRLMLSPVLTGEKRYEDIVTHDDDWYAHHGITLRKRCAVVSIDREARTVADACGETHGYDELVIATGSMPNRLRVPGAELDGVLVYRDLDDVERMVEAASGGGRAIVIGGGLLGLEAADGLAARGMDVTVLHHLPVLMDRQLDAPAAHLLKRAIEARGITVLTEANTAGIRGEGGRVTGVELADGAALDAELVVMAVGIRPSTALAVEAGLAVNRGILVDDAMRTSDPHVWAVGECVEHRETVYGLVAPLYEMADVLAANLLGGEAAYTGSMLSAKLKVNGVALFSAGDFTGGDGADEIVLRDAAAGVYRRIVLENDRIVGIVMMGDTSDSAWYFDKLRRAETVEAGRESLIFGRGFAGGAPADPTAAVAALPPEAEICGCNGVCKGRIVEAIETHGLTTIDEVRARTKASSSCGTCTGLVEQVMALTLGDAFERAAVTPMCGCTALGHDDVRRLIRSKALRTIDEVLQELEWKSSCGCAKCRPALNYYLVCEWPGDYEDDYQSRFVNERAHANIQKDGTYSVVPRMWGGMTSSAELRAIADVVDKFEIPAVKVTGGQRIDLLGVRKDDLPLVWHDLGRAGFVSGHAYAKGLRTVKTCVGTDWCRFGTQDSTGLGIRLERALWGSWSPAKVKLAVSGCPRNCAEATCKDIGVVCVDSGFDIHFAGAAGLEIRGTEVLCHVDTEDAVLEHAKALLQLYREQGHYLERIWKWAARIGLDEVRREVVGDGANRAALVARLDASQAVAQVDPWAARAVAGDGVAGEAAEARWDHEFRPLAALAPSPEEAPAGPPPGGSRDRADARADA